MCVAQLWRNYVALVYFPRRRAVNSIFSIEQNRPVQLSDRTSHANHYRKRANEKRSGAGTGEASQARHKIVTQVLLFASRIVVSVTNTSQSEAKITYIRLNQTPCAPRGAVPVKRYRRLFHFRRPDRFRSWLRLPWLCRPCLSQNSSPAGNFSPPIAEVIGEVRELPAEHHDVRRGENQGEFIGRRVLR